MIRLVPDRLRSGTQRGRVSLVLGAVAIGVLLVGLAWIVVTGLLARSRLNDVRSELHQLRGAVLAGDTDETARLVGRIRDQTSGAETLTSGPAWWVGSNLPGVGSPLQTARTIAQQSARLGHDVLPALLRIVDALPAKQHSSASIDLTLIARSAPGLHDAARTAHTATQTMEHTDGSWLPYVSNARDSVVNELRRLDGELLGADRAVGIALPMLGQSGPRRYFIGFLNEAESRAVGGIAGAFAIAVADRGRITFEHFGSDGDLSHVRANVDLGSEYNAKYHQDDPTGYFQNSTISPDFRNAAQIWAGMWEKKSGEHVDGAISVDPTALSYVLRETGGTTLPNGIPVNAANFVALTQQKQYTLFPGSTKTATAQRKQFLISVSKAVSRQLTSGGSTRGLVKAFTRAARERRLLVWSAQPPIERRLEQANWAGALVAPAGRPFSTFIVNNSTGSKLDYYLKRQVSYRSNVCGSAGEAVATMQLTDAAPAHLPPYVTFRLDKVPPGGKPGDESVLLTYYATAGATIKSFVVNGQLTGTFDAPENGLPTATARVQLRAGHTEKIQVTVAEPATAGPVAIVRQPLVHPLGVDLSGDRCGRAAH